MIVYAGFFDFQVIHQSIIPGPIVSSSSSMLEEPVTGSEEPKEYNAKPKEDIFLI